MRKDTNRNADFYKRVTIILFRCIQIPVKHFNVELYAKIAAFGRYFFLHKKLYLRCLAGFRIQDSIIHIYYFRL